MALAVFYIAVLLGAVGVYWTLPHGRSWAKVGPLLAAGAVGLGVVTVLCLIHSGATVTDPAIDEAEAATRYAGPPLLELIHMGLFSVISAAGAVRVITHKRPVYSALYFVLVVLSSAGMLVLLEAEFMAFAMVIIYGGAILITYMFVIMLATLPQSEDDTASGTVYDRFAREPGMAVVLGFVLVAVVGSVVMDSYGQNADGSPKRIANRTHAAASARVVVAQLPGKVKVDDDPSTNMQRVTRLERLLRQREMIGPDQHVFEVDLSRGVAKVSIGQGTRREEVVLDDEILGLFVANIDRVGLNLFEGHTLGIELAGVILLLSMVGAIVIARQKVPERSDLPD